MAHLTKAVAVAASIVLGAMSTGQAQTTPSLENEVKRVARSVVTEQLSDSHLEHIAALKSKGEIVSTKTPDGWHLVAHHVRPKSRSKPGADPVILCHGLSYNALFWSLDPSCDFAEYLSTLGYDVWVVDLRGCGLSQKWVWKLDDAPALMINNALNRLSKGKVGAESYATIDPKFANWSLDHHIYFDVPAFVHLVRQRTGATQVTWVGHSMGGIVALGHLSRFKNPGIGRLVTIGSQVTMPEGQLIKQFAGEMLAIREGQIAGKFVGEQLINQGKTSVDNMFFNVENALPNVYEALSGWAKDVPAVGLMRQYLVLAETGELYDVRRQFNYAKALGNIKIPVFVTCGADDQLAPPTVQKYLFDNIGSTDKNLMIFGKKRGFAVDSGHDDTLVGKHSKQQVYPVIERWIAGSRF